jgi:histidine triad (HIT) family protein
LDDLLLLAHGVNLRILTKNYSKLKFNFKLFNTHHNVNASEKTIFDKIINKEIKSNIVFEDDQVLAFKDINPVAPTHIIIIPKNKDGLSGISKAEEKNIQILGLLFFTAKKIADQLNISEGYRVVINEGKHGCQTINHLHLHLLAGKQFGWPPGTATENKKI